MKEDIEKILDRHWQELKALHPGILNVAIAEKFVNGVNTHQRGITIYVAKKLPGVILASNEVIPKEIERIPTDVIEFAPTTWKAGKTSISEKHPLEQKRTLGARKPDNPKAVMVAAPSTGLEVDWLAYFSAIQNQKSCGSCVAFGDIGVWEAAYRILINNPADPIKLSEADPFFCSGGTCGTGSDCPTFLNYCLAHGVVPEYYLPYKDFDQACRTGILPGWEQYVYKLKTWDTTANLATIRQWITSGPLVAVMEVHQSFFNYVSGVYHNLGPQDPVAGWHCIGRVGMSDTKQASHGRNSWGPNWGEGGYFWIGYNDSHFDDAAWQITPIVNSGPIPPPYVPLVITTTALPIAYLNTPYSFTLQASGGTPPYVWGIGGPLPRALSFDTKTGTISGTPTDWETAPLSITVADMNQTNTTVILTLKIDQLPTPSPCKVGNGVAKAMNIITFQKLRGRKGRFYYLDPPDRK